MHSDNLLKNLTNNHFSLGVYNNLLIALQNSVIIVMLHSFFHSRKNKRNLFMTF